MPDPSDPRPDQRPAVHVFGRRKGKPLRAGQRDLIDNLLPALRLDLSRPCPLDLAGLFPAPPKSVRLEIGFGGGEHLLDQAAKFPDAGFIGAEPFLNGVAKTVAAIAKTGVANIRLHDDDAVPLLDWLPPASIDRVDLLYPDPWPKKRHWKRRFVTRETLDRIARILKPGGEFRFASDFAGYVNWTLALCLAHPEFEWTARRARDWNAPWADWLVTRYEKKAIAEGRSPAYLIFRRR